jgi:hypothetical protein
MHMNLGAKILPNHIIISGIIYWKSEGIHQD